MTTLQNETLASLLAELKITEYQPTAEIDKLAATESKYLKDLKINVLNSLKYDNLSKKESYLLALSTAINEKHNILKNVFESLAISEGATENEIAEIISCVSLLNINNVFYRFRHFTKKEYYEQTPAGIKMGIMMNPVLGKEFFELVSLAISALNGCEMCVNAVRLVAIIKGFSVVF